MELKVFEPDLFKSNLCLDNQPSREDLIWDANGGLTEKQIEQYLILARYLFN
jgi:hypothetical protein